MTVDVDEIQFFYWGFHKFWISALMIGVVLYMLYWQLGNSVFLGIGVMAGAMVFNLLVAGYM